MWFSLILRIAIFQPIVEVGRLQHPRIQADALKSWVLRDAGYIHKFGVAFLVYFLAVPTAYDGFSL